MSDQAGGRAEDESTDRREGCQCQARDRQADPSKRVDSVPRFTLVTPDNPVHPTEVFRLVVEDNRQSFPDRDCLGSIGLPDLDHLPRRVSHLYEVWLEALQPLAYGLAVPAGPQRSRIASEELFVRGGPETEHLFHLFEIGLRPLSLPAVEGQSSLGQTLTQHAAAAQRC